jgi:hypothetical protein
MAPLTASQHRQASAANSLRASHPVLRSPSVGSALRGRTVLEEKPMRIDNTIILILAMSVAAPACSDESNPSNGGNDETHSTN